MVVTLTARHFRDLAMVTGAERAVGALAAALDADFSDEGVRYRYRDALTGLFAVWFGEHTADDIGAALARTSILWDRYRTFAELVTDPRVTENPLFSPLRQPGVGDYLAPGAPMRVDGGPVSARPAPWLGQDTVAVLGGSLGLSDAQIAELLSAATVAADVPKWIQS
jgi:2-methylfumaryl-CoA isomerase